MGVHAVKVLNDFVLDVPGIPGTPVISDITSTAMTLRWAPPDSDGGVPITTYIVERREQFSSRWVQSSRYDFTEGTFSVTGLKDGNEYEFRVAAKNKIGTGKFSEPTRPTRAKEPYGM